MEIQYGKMILHGIIAAIFYIGVPLGIFYALDYFGILAFDYSLIIGIVIFGVIGVLIAMLKSMFPKGTSANSFIMFIFTVFSGVYMFYIFGGFEAGRTIGTFSIDTPLIQAAVGIQLIAWLILAGAGLRSIQYLIETFEYRKGGEELRKGKFSFSEIFKIFAILANLILAGYIISVIVSGVLIDPNIVGSPTTNYDNGGTPINATDDQISFSLQYEVFNKGIYPLSEVYLIGEIWTITSDNESALPSDTLIGSSGLLDNYFAVIAPFTPLLNQTLNITISSTYLFGLVTTDAQLGLVFKISLNFAGIFANMTLPTIPIPWTAPI